VSGGNGRRSMDDVWLDFCHACDDEKRVRETEVKREKKEEQ
jgi:hypothetical protein